MTVILAAIDNSTACEPVVATALALAPTVGASVEAVQIADEPGVTALATAEHHHIPFRVVAGDPDARIAEQVNDGEVAAVVVGTRGRPTGPRPAGHTALALADRVDKPVVMVPPDARTPEHVERVLVAMDGSPGRAAALRQAIHLAGDAHVELIVVHVDSEDSIPSFSDQVAHETAAYAREFLYRYCGEVPARLETRVGVPAEEILAAARDMEPDLVAIGWPRSREPGHGHVVRQVLGASPVPVLLVALADQ
ncbi:MAG TPA: universal stress protein [Acidimicrobiales bacterium]|nr:universal stress protein [Acidimicrobiales bacterium]